MANSDFQRHSFLGGEVSPALYERADMDKFGKWFSTAENIRFFETGGFRNRAGFVKIADTRDSIAGQEIKLLSFSFNDEESFLVEFGPSYARFFKDGQPIMNGAVPYEIQTPFVSFSSADLKYAQAGDTIFITHPNYGIYELIRKNIAGTEWEFRPFKADMLPMKELNEEKTDTVSLDAAESQAGVVTFQLRDDANTDAFVNPTLVANGDNTYNYSLPGRVSHQQFVDSFNTNFSDDGVQASLAGDNKLRISFEDISQLTVTSLELTYSFEQEASITASRSTEYPGFSQTTEPDIQLAFPEYPLASYAKEISVTGEFYGRKPSDSTSTTTKKVTTNITSSMANSLDALVAQKDYLSRSENTAILGQITDTSDFHLSRYGGIKTKTISAVYIREVEDTLNIPIPSSDEAPKYVLTFDGADANNFLKNGKIQEGDSICLMNIVDSQSWSADVDTTGDTWTSEASNGKWRTYSLGNWKGNVLIEYSTDNKQTWVEYFKWASEDKDNYPYNISTSGTVQSDDSVYFKVTVTVTAGKVKIFFATDDYVVNSYYSVVFMDPLQQYALVNPIKNDIGEVDSNYKWRLPAFSQYEGYPQTLGFYQNRLFFAKDFLLYGSKTNDFWDFYEPISLQADDPITMSLLSTKANIIRNIVTQRSFFVFTSGGEYGIGSDGALTQNDKYLKAFSANGSSRCLPVLISDVVLFVDKSANSIRALKYSLESDGYEAPDITLMLKALLAEEYFTSTDSIFEDKEALFLSDTGTIWVLKYVTDQNVLSWSHWKHANGKITNICVVPNGAKHDLYIAVERAGKKWIEKLSQDKYLDTLESFAATVDEKVTVTGWQGEEKIVLQNGRKYKMTVDENSQITCPPDTTAPFDVGNQYVSTATLLSPTFQLSERSSVTYEVKNIFKVFFYYLNSYGFKVGVEDSEKMEIEWQDVPTTIDEEQDLTSGKKSVLIPSRFDSSKMLSFVQEEPYPMEIHDMLAQVDYGGK